MKGKIFYFVLTTLILLVGSDISFAQTTPADATPVYSETFAKLTPTDIKKAAVVLTDTVQASADCEKMEGDELERTKFWGENRREDQGNTISVRANQTKTFPMFLSYKTVRDSFGKRIDESFMVVQGNVQNKKFAK